MNRDNTTNSQTSFWRRMAAPGSVSGGGTAKATVAEHISQAVQSTSNLLHLMQHSSPAQVPNQHRLFIDISKIENKKQNFAFNNEILMLDPMTLLMRNKILIVVHVVVRC